MPAKPDALDRLVQLLLLIAAVTTIANGVFMLVKPLDWYVFVPTVVTTGPPNAHFIRDIGLAYIGSGLILLYAAANPVLRWRAALVGGLWLTFHGLLHIYEVAAGMCGPAQCADSMPTPAPSRAKSGVLWTAATPAWR